MGCSIDWIEMRNERLASGVKIDPSCDYFVFLFISCLQAG